METNKTKKINLKTYNPNRIMTKKKNNSTKITIPNWLASVAMGLIVVVGFGVGMALLMVLMGVILVVAEWFLELISPIMYFILSLRP